MGRMAVGAVRVALAAVAVAALLAVMATVGLGEDVLRALRLGLGRGLEALECLRLCHEVRRELSDGQALASSALDVAQVAALVWSAEGDRDAVGAGARSAADAVDVLLRNVGQVVVHDVADAR